MKISPAQQSALTEAIIEESGDVGKAAVPYATADRSRCMVNGNIASEVQKLWVAPKYASLHWDSKLMKSQATHDSQERLAIAIGENNNVKILGKPAYKPGTDQQTGNIITTMQLLQSWKCAESIANITFDTTASNTGHVSTCMTLQQNIGHGLLWSAGYHHVGEVILTQVLKNLHIQASKSSEVMVFNRFKKHFDTLMGATRRSVYLTHVHFHMIHKLFLRLPHGKKIQMQLLNLL